MSSQRNRATRGPNRNNGHDHAEEVRLWHDSNQRLKTLVEDFNKHTDFTQEMAKDLKTLAEMRERGESARKIYEKELALDNKFRLGVKQSEADAKTIQETITQIKILKALVEANESDAALQATQLSRTASSRSATAASAAAAAAAAQANASSVYDFDGAGDSPVPSPIGGATRKLGTGRGDSIPPRDRGTPSAGGAKAESVEPQERAGSSGSGAGTGSAAAGTTSSSGARSISKVTFAKGDEVAFKPKAGPGDEESWIQGRVQQVLGEGKSRRYKVQDIEPDESGQLKEYRTSASSMIPITSEAMASTLPPLAPPRTVLALYPESTTFYKAEIMGMLPDGRVELLFEGDSEENKKQVERRFVLEYRP